MSKRDISLSISSSASKTRGTIFTLLYKDSSQETESITLKFARENGHVVYTGEHVISADILLKFYLQKHAISDVEGQESLCVEHNAVDPAKNGKLWNISYSLENLDLGNMTADLVSVAVQEVNKQPCV